MKRELYVVASCTERKRLPPNPLLRLRGLKARSESLTDVIEEWWSRIAETNAPDLPACDLYAGDHWAVVTSLPRVATGYDISLLVASAGYGLVPAATRLRAYGATFTPRHIDSVHRFANNTLRGNSLLSAWWKGINQKSLHKLSANRTVGGLIKANPSARVLVIAGPTYVTALANDLLAARDLMKDPNHLIIVSSESSGLNDRLRHNLVPSTAKLQNLVGGALSALHARIARKILTEAEVYALDASQLRQRYSELATQAPESDRPIRKAVSDDQVRDFVRQCIKNDARSSFTRLLQEFRDGGRACEQSRFRGLYREVVEGGKDV